MHTYVNTYIAICVMHVGTYVCSYACVYVNDALYFQNHQQEINTMMQERNDHDLSGQGA